MLVIKLEPADKKFEFHLPNFDITYWSKSNNSFKKVSQGKLKHVHYKQYDASRIFYKDFSIESTYSGICVCFSVKFIVDVDDGMLYGRICLKDFGYVWPLSSK